MMRWYLLLVMLGVSVGYASENKMPIETIDSILALQSPKKQMQYLDSTISWYLTSEPTYSLLLNKRYFALANEYGSDKEKGTGNFQLGVAYEMLGDFEKALAHLQEARRIFQRTGDKLNLGFVFNEIGLVYSEQSGEEMLRKSMEYQRKFLQVARELENNKEIAGAMSNIAWLFASLKEYDSALKYNEEALRLRLIVKDKRSIGISYGNLGYLHTQTGEFRKAEEYYRKTMKIYNEIGYTWGIYEVYYDLAWLNIKQDKLDEAGNYMQLAYDLSLELNSKSLLKKTFSLMSDYYERTGDFKMALTSQKKYQAYVDSTADEDIRRKLVQMQSLYDSEMKDQQIILLEQKNKVKQLWVNTLIIGSLIVVIVIAYALVVTISRRKKEKEIFEIEKELHIKKEDLNKEKLEKSVIKEKELQTELEYKSKQLTTHALNMMQKNKLLQDIQLDIDGLRKKTDSTHSQEFKRIQQMINLNLKSENDWELFRMYFEQVNKNFFNKLREINPSLTNYDLRLCALLKLNMNIKETASVLNVEPNSIKSARYRLRKKLNLQPEQDLYDFVREIN